MLREWGEEGENQRFYVFFSKMQCEVDILFLDNVKHHNANIAIAFRVRVYALVALKASVSHPSPT